MVNTSVGVTAFLEWKSRATESLRRMLLSPRQIRFDILMYSVLSSADDSLLFSVVRVLSFCRALFGLGVSHRTSYLD